MSKCRKNVALVNWQNEYSTLQQYYDEHFDSKYYKFSKLERIVDPSETIEQIEAYGTRRQHQEIARCAKSFEYFCTKYLKIVTTKYGLIPFALFNYQRKAIRAFENEDYTIVGKFRQGGLTTVAVLYCLYRCMFKLDETFMVVSKSDREAIASGEIVSKAIEHLPGWLKPAFEKNNDHQKIFSNTGCKLFFQTITAARGRTLTYLVIDEAAHINNMDDHWKAIFPTLSSGGKCIAISTANGIGNWYEKTYHQAERGENDFKVVKISYRDHPFYNNPEWVRAQKAQLGPKGWRQEVLGDFLGGGDTWIQPETIVKYQTRINESGLEPKYLFPEWASELDENLGGKERDPGALMIFSEPKDGKEYIIGVDAAGAIGADGDYTCAQIIDAANGEQVAEFYSNICPTHIFAQILAQMGRMYNLALIVVENEKFGNAILDRLEHTLHYENIYESTDSRTSIKGVRTNKNTRDSLLENFRALVMSECLPIWSLRLIDELQTFVINKRSKKPEAAKGAHDDALMALAIAHYANDMKNRFEPVYDVVEGQKRDASVKLLDSIQQELEKVQKDILSEEKDHYEVIPGAEESDFYQELLGDKKNKSLLREFGW